MKKLILLSSYIDGPKLASSNSITLLNCFGSIHYGGYLFNLKGCRI